MQKIIADLELLIAECWETQLKTELEGALQVLKDNQGLEGYDD